ncbi:Oidioi.mRNA.OKI2018_I69.PAR.g10318.t1.cds [Oikopleura dioica]|uniref:Oidioi.mRNA.OKI2018_I69.PAR.g10318.t1.cds n=1 Tax=Oikopleura dioica TaxID=34765 RepID=A0ABN7RQ22_OIKDI|nr:Oidioi.mRNA.OKI2018_I69.PAR.g10318.t1.cds [Oikopleura dioica]
MAVFTSGQIMCTFCLDFCCTVVKNAEELRASVKLIPSDAELKCPAANCEAKNLSFREFKIGKCCDKAMAKQNKKALDNQEYVSLVHQNLKAAQLVVEKGEGRLKNAEIAAKQAEDYVELEKKNLEWAKKDIERMKGCLKDAYLMAYTKSLRELSISEDEGPACNVCLEGYNKEERHECTLHCGHRSCHKCLTGLPEKICPICRKEFTNEQIIKLF